MNHRQVALIVALGALAMDMVCGVGFAAAQHIAVWHGIYCALANAATVGGDVAPTTGWGYAVNFIELLTIVPLFGASVTFFASGLTELHVRKHMRLATDEIKQHVSDNSCDHTVETS